MLDEGGARPPEFFAAEIKKRAPAFGLILEPRPAAIFARQIRESDVELNVSQHHRLTEVDPTARHVDHVYYLAAAAPARAVARAIQETRAEDRITVLPLNEKPVANAQEVTTEFGGAVSIDLTGTDPEGQPLHHTFGISATRMPRDCAA